MQFMAYYNEDGGLYLATHDKDAYLKSFEYYADREGICLELRVYTDGAKETYIMNFEIVLGVFDGDWYDAAEIYRSRMEKNSHSLPEKLFENKRIPQWYSDSPVVALYPVRGKKIVADQTNLEELSEYALSLKDVKPESGRQEYLESVVN